MTILSDEELIIALAAMKGSGPKFLVEALPFFPEMVKPKLEIGSKPPPVVITLDDNDPGDLPNNSSDGGILSLKSMGSKELKRQNDKTKGRNKG